MAALLVAGTVRTAAETENGDILKVRETVNAPETREGKPALLRKIRDSYEKIVDFLLGD